MDPGEKISTTLKREFEEEALNSLQKSPDEKAELEKQLHKLFSQEHFVVSSVSLVIGLLSSACNSQLCGAWKSVAKMEISCDARVVMV